MTEMQKIYIATIAECDEDGELYTAITYGNEDWVLGGINDYFEQESEDGHHVADARFDTLDQADGFDSFDSDNANHYHVLVTTANIPQTVSVPVPNDNDIVLDTIRNWVNNPCAYLSDKPGYAKGYKDGIIQAKEMVRNMLDCTGKDRYVDVVTSFHDDKKGAWAIDAYTGPDPEADDAGHTVAWIHDDGTVEWVIDSAKNSTLVKEAITEKIKEIKL